MNLFLFNLVLLIWGANTFFYIATKDKFILIFFFDLNDESLLFLFLFLFLFSFFFFFILKNVNFKLNLFLISFFFLGIFVLAIIARCYFASSENCDLLFSSAYFEIRRNWSYLELSAELKRLFVANSPRNCLTQENFDIILNKVWVGSKSMAQLHLEFNKLLKISDPWYTKFLTGWITSRTLDILLHFLISSLINNVKYYVLDPLLFNFGVSSEYTNMKILNEKIKELNDVISTLNNVDIVKNNTRSSKVWEIVTGSQEVYYGNLGQEDSGGDLFFVDSPVPLEDEEWEEPKHVSKTEKED